MAPFASFSPELSTTYAEPDAAPPPPVRRGSSLDDGAGVDEDTRAQLAAAGTTPAAASSTPPPALPNFDAGGLASDGPNVPTSATTDDELAPRWTAALADMDAVLNLGGRWYDPVSTGSEIPYKDQRNRIADAYEQATKDGNQAAREVACKGMEDLAALARAKLLSGGAPANTVGSTVIATGQANASALDSLGNLFKGAGLLLTAALIALLYFALRKK